MANVTGYTAEHMDALMAENIVGGEVDGAGHLILETRGGGELDAGSVFPTFAAIANLLYPVGCIYTSVDSADPGALFGGTWVAFGAGRVPIGVDAGDTRFDAAQETGGSDTISANHLPAHTHAIGGSSGTEGAHTHVLGGSTGADAAHTHPVNINSNYVSHDHTHAQNAFPQVQTTRNIDTASAASDNGGQALARGTTSGRFGSTIQLYSPGSTGGISQNHYHNVAGDTSAGTSHAHTLPAATGAPSATHAHSLPANTGANTTTADKFLPPYISVYMWRRTA